MDHAVVPPWAVDLTDGERIVVQYGVVVAALALGAMLLRLLAARREVSDRYRPAVHAGVGVTGVAFLSYLFIAIEQQIGYQRRGGVWVPTGDAVSAWAARYMDWTVSVPLLVVELVAVTALVGRAARRTRSIGIAAAVLMIVLGFIGGVAVDGGRSFGALLGFGLASSVCFVVLYVVIITAVVRSLPVLPAAARSSLTSAMVVLLIVWFAYPVVFGLQGLVSGGAWTAGESVGLSVADVIAKVGFGLLIHRTARARTAADVLAGEDVHPESVWIDQLRHAEAVLPPSRPPLP